MTLKTKYLHRAGIQGAMIHHHFWEEIQLKSSHHFSAYHKPLMLDHCPVEPIEYHHLSSAGLNTLSHIEKHSNHRNISSGRPATDTTKTGWTGKETWGPGLKRGCDHMKRLSSVYNENADALDLFCAISPTQAVLSALLDKQCQIHKDICVQQSRRNPNLLHNSNYTLYSKNDSKYCI